MNVVQSLRELEAFYAVKPVIAPNLFLIGAMRSGTTTLHNLIAQHPEIFMSANKEPMFFLAEALREMIRNDGGEKQIALKKQLADFVSGGKFREVEKYRMLFSSAGDYSWRGESSHYLNHKVTAAEIFKHAPEARIIVSLRNPVDRLYSEYLLYQRLGREEGNFSDFVWEGCQFDKKGRFLSAPVGNRINKGFYSKLLQPWMDLFGESQVKIVLFEDLCRDPGDVCQSIYSWLGLADDFQPKIIHAQRSGIPKTKAIGEWMRTDGIMKKILKNITPKDARVKVRDIAYRILLDNNNMSSGLRKKLFTIYQSDIESLELLINRDLSNWKSIN
ncbi:MAG: sulfotransferase family protein [Arenicellales bacterium]